LHGKVAHHIGRRIVGGAIAEGDCLPRESELARQFSVSRQAVREALKVLAAKGLVHSRRRAGTHVQPRSSWNLLDPDVIAWHPPERVPADFLRDLFDLRRQIEPAAAEFAAQRASPQQISAIGQALEEMRRSIGDQSAFIEADLKFHASISAASGNVLFDRLSGIYAPLLEASFALQVQVTPRHRVESDTLPTHTALYDAIAARDPVAARRASEILLSGAMREVEMIAGAASSKAAG
jgi:GntR family galactonate operon transcriptional repressor